MPAKAVLIVSHGLAEHAGRYQRFAEFMAATGFHVYAHDHRGHGATVAGDASIGRFAEGAGVAKVIADLQAIAEMAAAGHPGLPIVLFGHSMGGLVALNAVETHPEFYDGLAVWNSNFHPGLPGRVSQVVLLLERMRKGSDVPSALLSKLTFDAWSKSVPDRTTAFDWLSHDKDEVAKYIGDPLCGFDPSVSLWRDMLELAFSGVRQDRLRRLPRDLPIHLVGGAEDPATKGGEEMRWLAKRMAAAGLTRVETTVYLGMRHETLNETGRDRAMQDFAAWCGSIGLARQGVGAVPPSDRS